MRTTYEVRVTVEVIDTTKKSHKPSFVVKRSTWLVGCFGDGKPYQADRKQARRFASALVDSVKAFNRAVHIFAGDTS
jgi:hypothetical protein